MAVDYSQLNSVFLHHLIQVHNRSYSGHYRIYMFIK